MSTLLERMIQRTRGPLSSLEPLSRPRFAPTQAGQQLWAGSAGEIVETTVDGPGVPAPVRHAARPGGLRPAGERLTGRYPGDGPAVSGVAPRPGEDEPPPALPAAPPLELPSAAARRSDKESGPPPAHPAPRHQDTGPLLAHPAIRHRPRDAGQAPAYPATGHRLLREAGQAPAHPAAEPARRADGGSRDARERGIAEPAPASAGEPAPEPEAPTAARPAVPGRGPEPAAPRTHGRAGSAGSQAPPRPATGTGGSGPDVTISIGHIEVRASPPAERPPARPPFRPHVSLDDFLNQRQDRRP